MENQDDSWDIGFTRFPIIPKMCSWWDRPSPYSVFCQIYIDYPYRQSMI